MYIFFFLQDMNLKITVMKFWFIEQLWAYRTDCPLQHSLRFQISIKFQPLSQPIRTLKGQRSTGTHPCGVSSFWVVLQYTRETKIWDFAHQVAVDEDVTSSQIPMDVTHIRQVLHARCDPSKHAHQLDHCELGIMLLENIGNAISGIAHIPSCTDFFTNTLEAPRMRSLWVRRCDLNAMCGTMLLSQSAEGRGQICNSDKNSFFPFLLSSEF